MRSSLVILFVILFVATLSLNVFGEQVELKSSTYLNDKGIQVSVLSVTTYRAVVTGNLIGTDFIGTIKNNNKYPISSVGITVHILDCEREKKLKCEYKTSEVMWIDMLVPPQQSRQFKQDLLYFPSISIKGEDVYQFDLLGVIKS